MHRIGVIGDKDSILVFKAVGFSVFEANTAEEGEKVLHALVKEDYGVIYVTEQIAAKIQHVLETYRKCRIPAIITIPGNQGSLGVGMDNIRKLVEKAVGINILLND
ncbi:MAG: V-type ATP synthase subunit F [Clostridiaceae bacterium]|nr:V-type ATP synthase subunit F [Clostridiaceae bacterium]